MNSASQWNETDSACELLASEVSVYTPAVSNTDTEGGGGGAKWSSQTGIRLTGSQRKWMKNSKDLPLGYVHGIPDRRAFRADT